MGNVISAIHLKKKNRAMKKIILLLFAASNINNGFAQSPGGFGTTNMNLWVKADAGTSSTTDGASLSSWNDQSGSGNNGTQIGTLQPTYQEVSTNYNSGIDIVGNAAPKQHFLLPDATIPGGGSDYTVLYVANNVTSTGFVIAAGVNVDLQANRFRIDVDGGTNNSWQNSAVDLITPPNATLAGKRLLYSNNFNSAAGGRTTFLQSLDAGSITSTSINTSTSNNKIGLREEGGGQLIGDINEILVYSYSLSSLNQTKAETYLAVKYGVTLNNTGGGTQGDYVATDGTNIWDADNGSTYHNNVIGIGRDDSEALLQKQSHSVDDSTRIYLNTLQTTNSTNTGTFSNDISYIVVGNNGAAVFSDTNNVEKPAGCALYSRLEREWKMTKTNISEDVSVDITLHPNAIPASVNIAELRFLVDDDSDFSNGGTTCYFNGDANGTVITYNNPIISISNISTTHIANNSTKYYTIGSSSRNTPLGDLTALPIQLVNFSANCDGGNVMLNWTTASEKNNDRFIIEKSRNGKNYEIIGERKGAGNSSMTNEYTWNDRSFLSTNAYYRIKQIDYNGKSDYSKVVHTNCYQDNFINIYPNPFENTFTIQLFSQSTSDTYIDIVDCLGKVVYKTVISGETKSINISLDEQLAKGTYYVKISNQGLHIVKRITK